MTSTRAPARNAPANVKLISKKPFVMFSFVQLVNALATPYANSRLVDFMSFDDAAAYIWLIAKTCFSSSRRVLSYNLGQRTVIFSFARTANHNSMITGLSVYDDYPVGVTRVVFDSDDVLRDDDVDAFIDGVLLLLDSVL